MVKQILIQLITKGLVFDLALLELSYFFSWLIVLKLGFRILGVRVELKKFFPGALIGASINLFIKPFLPVPIAALTQFVLVTFFLKTYGKQGVIKSFWTTFLTLFIIIIGTTFVEGPLCLLDKKIAVFFTKNQYGMIVSVFIETLFPAILLLILSKYDFSIIPPFRKKPTVLDIIGVLTFGCMFFSIYNSTFKLCILLTNNPEKVFTHLTSDWITTVGSILGGYLILTAIQKQREIERRNLESELATKQRDLESEQEKFESERRKFITEKETLEARIRELDELNNRLKDRKLGPEEVDDFFNKLRSYGDLVIQNMKRSDECSLPPAEDNNVVKPEVLTAIKFTRREKDVLRLLATGESNEAIARKLHLSLGRVINIVSDLKSKTDLDKNKLIVYAIDWVKQNPK